MAEVTSYPQGTFCWVDLGTTDVPPEPARRVGAVGAGGNLVEVPAEQPPVEGSGPIHVVAGIHGHTEDEGTAWSSSIAVDDATV